MRERVLTVHGIWTSGKWQQVVASVFDPHFECIAIKYRHYRWLGPLCLVLEPYVLLVLGLTLLSFRRWPVSHCARITAIILLLVVAYLATYVRRYFAFSTFLKQTGDYARPAKQTQTHIIAHSLGTYLTGRALQTRNDFHIGRVVLVGCVLPRRFPWQKLRAVGTADDQYRYLNVRNDLARKDLVVYTAWLMSWLVRGLGLAGFAGFKGSSTLIHDPEDPTKPCSQCPCDTVRIHNVLSKHLGHSGTFVSSMHAEVFWLPFLWGIDPSEYADFLRLCNAAAALDREWTDDAWKTGYVDKRLIDIEKRLRELRWGSTGTFEDSVLKEVLSRYRPDTEELDDLTALAVRGVWQSVRQAMQAWDNRDKRRKQKLPNDPTSDAAIAWLNPYEAMRRSVALL